MSVALQPFIIKIQRTKLPLFRGTSNWGAFHEALTKDENKSEHIQYPGHWVGTIVKDTISTNEK